MTKTNNTITHEMHLNSENFDAILTGSKIVETRLYDEKRKKINVGDKILFYKVPDSSNTLSVRVVKLSKFNTLKEMIDAIPINYWRKKAYTKQELLNANWPYTSEQIQKYGLLAIQIDLI
ncbi:MAG: ASCH domain-containing protein [Candidatus Woesearchaeota archaeon]